MLSAVLVGDKLAPRVFGMEGSAANQARFGAFELNLKAGELCKGTRKIVLQEQPFQILLLLLKHRGEVVSRDEIKNRLWPNDTIVEFDHSIHTAIKKLRQALGDSAENPKYIETVARRGYRLITRVELIDASPAMAAAGREISPPQPQSTARDLVGKRVSHYRVLNVIGGGAMGLVYQAEDLKLDRRVALKFLPEELMREPLAIERLRREARAASVLTHPNICTVHAIEEEAGHPFIVMELLEGSTLRDRIAQAKLSIEETLVFSIQIAEALEAAHEKGVVHRDIKPANIFITARGQLKILDFGVAKLARYPGRPEPLGVPIAGAGSPEHLTRADLTKTGVTMGTAAYMSPEQIRGEELDCRTDLFSFGLVLYEMATGRQAFAQATVALLHDAILNRAPIPVRELNPRIPAALAQIIERAMQTDRRLRWQSAAEMRDALARLRGRQNRDGRRPAFAAVISGFFLLAIAAALHWQQAPATARIADLKQRQLTTNDMENPVWGGAISPDGQHLAYSDSAGIHLKDLATGRVEDLSQPTSVRGRHVDWRVYWFPDNNRLLANASVAGEGDSVWIASRLNKNLRKLRENASAWGVAPDGRSIAFTQHSGRYGPRELWLMDSSTETVRKLRETDGYSGFDQVRFSRDGRRLAYVKYLEQPNDAAHAFSRHAHIKTIETSDLAGSPPATIVSNLPGDVRDFLWLSNDRLILLLSEPDINLYSCNYWEQPVDARTGHPRGALRKVTDWAGFCMDHMSATADGKRLVFKRWWIQRFVYVSDLRFKPFRITPPRRLSHSEANEMPVAWTADSQSVIFLSNRTHSWDIFRQALGEQQAESIVGGLELSATPSVSPNGLFVLYVDSSKENEPRAIDRLMRVPITGGPQQILFTGRIYGQHCAKSPSDVCAMAERTPDRKQLVFQRFNPVAGRIDGLSRFDVDPAAEYTWDLSPDGVRIALHKLGEGRILILSLTGGSPLELIPKNWRSIETLNWSADGTRLFVASRTQQSSVLLSIDMQSNVQVVWESKGTLGNEAAGTSGIPSPDGRRLAMMGFTESGNMWQIEGY